MTGLLCGEYGLVYCMLLQGVALSGHCLVQQHTGLVYCYCTTQQPCDRATASLQYGLVYCMLLQRDSVTGLLFGEYRLVYCMLLQRGSVTGLL